jgi:putative SOS response-associated peptidase YedK
MCGRFALIVPPSGLRAHFGYVDQPNFPPRYNIAPTQPVPVVRLMGETLRFDLMRWGFIPAWAKDPRTLPLVINIRAETAAEKPMFRGAYRYRRALMPVDGFYEWHRPDAALPATPYLFRRPDRAPFAFAALWETYSDPSGGELDTVALLNGVANNLMAPIHHRCPVVLDPADYARWLDPATSLDDVAALLKPPPDDLLECVRIGPAIGKVANDGPFVQHPADAAQSVSSDEHVGQAARKAEKPKVSSLKTKAMKAPDQGSLF